MAEFHRVLRNRLGRQYLAVQLLVAGHLGGEHAADLVGNALAVFVDFLAGEILVLGHVGQNGRYSFGEPSAHFVDLLILDFLGLFRSLGDLAGGRDFFGNGFGELLDFFRIELGDFLVGHEDVGRAFRDGVFEKLVDGFNVTPGFLGGGLQLGFVFFAQGGDFILAFLVPIFHGLLIKEKTGTTKNEGGENDCGNLIFELLPHVGVCFEYLTL